jgi:Flp pilus assembly protein TadG
MIKNILYKAAQAAKLTDQKGLSFTIVALMLFVIMGFTALSVELSNIYGVLNELHNAADAGALAGARFLYNDDGTQVNAGANQIAYDAATANRAQSESGTIAVDVNWASGQNTGANVDVQRGHWSFATRTFTANDTLAPPDLWNRTTAELDADPTFINAVRVVARRQQTPTASFFARIFGINEFILSRQAVAYLGFAGSLTPGEADQPIAICRQSILNEYDEYSCAAGRMINSGGGTTHNSGAWTNFSQDLCQTASVPTVRPLVCSGGNPDVIELGQPMGDQGGMQDTVYNDLRDCWLNDLLLPHDPRGYPTAPWAMTLPVIECPLPNPGPCDRVTGAVTMDVVWVKQSGADPHWNDIPVQMDAGGHNWVCSACTSGCSTVEEITGMTDVQRQGCWQEFAATFNLLTPDGTSAGTMTASDIQKTIFILPSCEPHEPSGTTGGENYGVLAKIPVLVK